MRLFSIGVVLSVFAMASAAAQTRPDFSGRWTSEPEAATTAPQPGAGGRGRGGTAGDMGSGWASTIAITQDVKTLTVEYAFFGRGDLMPPLRFVYALDGSETTNSVMMGRGIQTQTSRATWNEDALVITTTYPFTDPSSGKPATATITRTLRLASPASLVLESTIGGALGGPPSTFKTVYRKL